MKIDTPDRINLRAARTAMIAAGLNRRAVERWHPMATAPGRRRAGRRRDAPYLPDRRADHRPDGREAGADLLRRGDRRRPAAVAEFLAEADGDDVVFMINSPGGSVASAADICSQMDLYAGKVTCRIVGDAASAASFIAATGDRVEVGTLSMVMIHAPWLIAAGNSNELRRLAEMLDKQPRRCWTPTPAGWTATRSPPGSTTAKTTG